MTTYLLDANVLIALTIQEHEHREPVRRWITTVPQIAVCPFVEGALVRFLVRIGESSRSALTALRRLHDDPRCEFWPDSLSYIAADLSRVHGHRQVTDAYLIALVAAHPDARLATLDRTLARLHPELTTLVPEL